ERLETYYAGFEGDNAHPDISVTAIECEPPDTGIVFTPKQPDPGKTKIKEEYCDFPDGRVVKKRLTGMMFMFGGGFNMAAGYCEINYNQVVNFINNRYIEWMLRRDNVLMHSAGVCLNGMGLAISGFSGRGKSTLALSLMSRGLKFVSNDRLMIKRDDTRLMMSGVPKMPRVNPGTLVNDPRLSGILPQKEREKFGAMMPEELWQVEQKYDVDISSIYGSDRFVLSAVMAGLVVINWDRGSMEPFSMEPVGACSRSDLYSAFMKTPGLFMDNDVPGRDIDLSEAVYRRILEQCPIYEITGKVDFEEATERCIEILETAANPAVDAVSNK
ncbi:MAG: HprK-related kinase B, partial [Spirochaetia bacterium]|nr:HprK-related kinase B [Spirochaetia bacterium]